MNLKTYMAVLDQQSQDIRPGTCPVCRLNPVVKTGDRVLCNRSSSIFGKNMCFDIPVSDFHQSEGYMYIRQANS